MYMGLYLAILARFKQLVVLLYDDAEEPAYWDIGDGNELELKI